MRLMRCASVSRGLRHGPRCAPGSRAALPTIRAAPRRRCMTTPALRYPHHQERARNIGDLRSVQGLADRSSCSARAATARWNRATVLSAKVTVSTPAGPAFGIQKGRAGAGTRRLGVEPGRRQARQRGARRRDPPRRRAVSNSTTGQGVAAGAGGGGYDACGLPALAPVEASAAGGCATAAGTPTGAAPRAPRPPASPGIWSGGGVWWSMVRWGGSRATCCTTMTNLADLLDKMNPSAPAATRVRAAAWPAVWPVRWATAAMGLPAQLPRQARLPRRPAASMLAVYIAEGTTVTCEDGWPAARGEQLNSQSPTYFHPC